MDVVSGQVRSLDPGVRRDDGLVRYFSAIPKWNASIRNPSRR
jgi:hypothetical protein